MPAESDRNPQDQAQAESDGRVESQAETPEDAGNPAREIGGRKGPDPTRFGDWEKNGRCIDF